MSRLRTHAKWALLVGGMIGLASAGARAGSVQMHLQIGGVDFDLSSGGFYDSTGGVNPDIVTIDSKALNSDLTAAGFKLQVAGIQALSNNDGDPGGAFLKESGTFSLLAGAGTVSWTLLAFQTDFHIPSGGPGNLQNSAAANYSFTALGDFQAFKSWQDNSNTGVSPVGPPPVFFGTGSPTVLLVSPDLTGATTTASLSGTSPLTPLASVAGSYAIANRFDFKMTDALPSDGFSGTSTVSASAVPEPASAMLILSSLPFVVLGIVARRRKGGA